MTKKKGVFIVLDGLDGCGKGSQALKLMAYLFTKDKRNHVFLTREPYNSEHYDEIRRILKESKNPRDNAELLAELFVKDRRVHVKLIEWMLENGFLVIDDRYDFSTYAYQWAQGVPLKKLLDMHKGILAPDLTIILDVPANVAMERLAKDNGREYKEVFEQLSFQQELRKNFLALPAQMPGRNIVVVDGNRPFEEVAELIKVEVDKVLAAE